MPERILYLGGGLAVVAVILGFVFFGSKGAHIRLEGSVQKVRMLPTDEKSAVVVVDFRFANPANYPFVVRTVQVFADMKSGDPIEGMSVSDVDAKRMFDYYAELGPKYNDSLLIRDKIAPRSTLDRMVAARFDVPEARLDQRARIRIRVEDVDGASSEIVEER